MTSFKMAQAAPHVSILLSGDRVPSSFFSRNSLLLCSNICHTSETKREKIVSLSHILYIGMGLFAKLPTSDVGDLALLHLQGDAQPPDTTEMRASCLPAEWFPQSGVQLTWPHAGTDWKPRLREVTDCYLRLAYEISTDETLLIVTPEPDALRRLLQEKLPRRCNDRIELIECPTNDTWARDHGFITVLSQEGAQLLDFQFNGWGNKFPSSLDNAINRHVYASGILRGHYTDCLDMVLEGGSIESDGRGTLLTTASCLLSPNRNPALNQPAIEERLCHLLQCRRILWLHHGQLEGDDTDGHIDTLARLCPGDTIAYVSCSDSRDSHYEQLKALETELQAFRTLEDKPYRLVPLPLPDPVYDETTGERLPATYANFLILNHKILLPTYAQPDKDKQAHDAMQRLFPKLSIIDIDSRILISQHGSIHCATMQFPQGVVQHTRQL